MYKDMMPADVFHDIGKRTNGVGIAQPIDHATLERQVFEHQERYVRLAADFDNFKKRIARELDQRCAAQKEEFIHDLLPVIDNLDRALANSGPGATDPLRQGVEMTFKQFIALMRVHGLYAREDLGKPFNPAFHEAVCTRIDARQEDQGILEVWQRGWMRGDTLFRAAKVVVNDLRQPLPTTS